MSENSMIQVYVATHKQIDFPLPDYCAKMQVNTAVNTPWPDYLHDADGENIAEKNANYSELTVLYSLWKNCDADIKGLMHYRRYLSDRDDLPLYHADTVPKRKVRDACISEAHILASLETHDVIIPVPEGPYPRNVAEDLLRFCYLEDINRMIDVVEEHHPAYVPALHAVLASEHVSYCNMMIAKKALFDDYCAWLFDILFEVEARCDLSGYDAQHARIYGYLSEILMDVYLLHRGCHCKYQQIFMPVDDTSGALRLRSELKRARNRVHDALHLPPLHPYHRSRYHANRAQSSLREKLKGANLIPAQAKTEAAKATSVPSYDPSALAEQIRAQMKSLGAKPIRPFPAERGGNRPGILAHFKESDFLYVILQPGDIGNTTAMEAFLADLRKRSDSLAQASGIPALIRLVVPEPVDDATFRAFMRQGIRLYTADSIFPSAR